MSRKRNKPGKLNRDRRKHFISTIAAILREGEPTPFAHEAACRHGLRIRLIFEAWGWADADALSADIVATALRMVGARRPTWYQGQPEYTQEGYAPTLTAHCRRCHKPLADPETSAGWNTSFCSNACRRSSQRRGELMTQCEYVAALRAASEVKKLEREITCAHCSTVFVPKKALWPPAPPGKPRYCSNGCSKAAFWKRRQADRAAPEPRPCGWCSKVFAPNRHEQRFCTSSCANFNRAAARKASAFMCAESPPVANMEAADSSSSRRRSEGLMLSRRM